MTVSKDSINRMLTTVKIVARKMHRPGSPFLDIDEILGMGHEVIAQILRDVRAGQGSEDLPFLVRATQRRLVCNVLDKRRALDCYKKHSADEVVASSLAREIAAPEDAETPTPDRILDAQIMLRHINDRLTNLEFYVFYLSYIDDKMPNQISEELDIPRHTIRRAFNKLTMKLSRIRMRHDDANL